MEFDEGTSMAVLCRTCLKDITNLSSMNIYKSASQGSFNIHNMLRVICSQVFVAEHEPKLTEDEFARMPQCVCFDCLSAIEAAYDLHLMCIESNRKLWELIATKQEPEVKQEIDETIQIEATQLPCPKMHVESINPAVATGSETEGEDEIEEKPDDKSIFYRCERCRAHMKSFSTVMKHMKRMHPDEILTCSLCHDVFFTEAKLEEHQLLHGSERPHSCEKCHKRFVSLTSLQDHIRTHDVEKSFLCTDCGKAFKNNATLKAHSVRHTKRVFGCPQCPSKFYHKGDVKTHMLTHTKEKKFFCDICGSRFALKSGLKKHKYSIHSGERPFPCDICDMKFISSDHVKRHMRTHTGEKPYKCSACDRAFAQSNDLVKHSKSHFGNNPYQCDRCESSFRLLKELRDHYKVHFQPGNTGNSEVMQALVDRHPQQTDNDSDELRFTITSALKRRAEQEKQRNRRQKSKSKIQKVLKNMDSKEIENND